MKNVGKTLKTLVLSLAALSLAGCFNNMSGLEESGSKKSAQANGATLNDSGFASETGPIETLAVVIGNYADASGGGFGVMVDLQKSLLATLGATALQTILDTIDTNSAMQARPVVIHLAGYGAKATTTLGKIAAGNNKKLRNVMNIRPRLSRIDLTTSALEIPASPQILQLKNSNKTVITYGGKIEGDYVRRMTTLIPFAGVNATYLPSASVPTYGDGYPAASPEEYAAGAVRLTRVTAGIASLFNKMMTQPPYGTSIYNSVTSDAIRTILQTRDSLGLSVHYKKDAVTGLPTTTIEAAYFININPANNAGPETFPFCHEGYDDQEQSATYGTAGDEVLFSHPLACTCTVAEYQSSTGGAATALPTPSQFVDPCPLAAGTPIKATLLSDAVTATPVLGAASLGVVAPTTLNDITLEAE